MNFVCFSTLTVPKNTAQAFTACRFYSALAQAGCRVHLVTFEQPEELAPDICAELLDSRIEVIRIPFKPPRNVRIWERFRNRSTVDYHWWDSTSLAARDKVAEVLRKVDQPILISRSYPLESHLTVYDIRREARLWIPHFSDPWPIPLKAVIDDLNSGALARIRYRYNMAMVRKIIRESGFVTVTCRNAIGYFSETYRGVSADRFHVCQHIGSPPLKSAGFQADKEPGSFNIVHTGGLAYDRYPGPLVREFSQAAEKWPQLRLTLYGRIENLNTDSARHPWLRLMKDSLADPRVATDLIRQSDMNLVVDTETILPYSPFLASKFAYAVGAGRPLLGVGESDSAMARLRDEFGSTYFADITKHGELADLLLKIRDEHRPIPTPNPSLQDRFFATTVIGEFLNRVRSVFNNS